MPARAAPPRRASPAPGPPADEFGGPPDRGEAFWRSDDSASSSSSVSDEDDDADDAARGTARTKQTSDENDALLFDPDADDEDQRWADERRAVGRAEDPTTRDDDRDDDDRCVLSCACCFVDVSVDASPASRRDDGRYVASRVTNVAMGDGGSEGPRRDPAEGRRGGMPFRCEACGEALGTVDGGGESRRRFRFDVGAVVPSTA